MSRILTYHERAASRQLSRHHDEFLPEVKFAADVGAQVLDELVVLGLAKKGPSNGGNKAGWRITDDGWRCMYGCTAEEIAEGHKTLVPLRIWRWPP
jgi:hypothetical protein